MAIRPDNHIIGDKAVRKISNNLIPEEWTISTPESDYGLDMLIEVVHNNQTTGRLFFIQSKGTIESSANGYITYPMDVARDEFPIRNIVRRSEKTENSNFTLFFL